MAHVRKYAHLADIDDAPDIYESPEVEADDDDNGSRSSHGSADDEEQQATGISRTRLRPDQARDRFDSSRVDASKADFSDRVSAKKQSYIVSNRRKKNHVAGERSATSDEEHSSEDDSDEGLARRIARLNREIEEVKGIMSSREEIPTAEGTQQTNGQTPDLPELSSLTKALDTVQASQRQAVSAHARLLKQLAERPTAFSTTEASPISRQSQIEAIDKETLAKIASFDTRLASLENALGLNALDLTSSNTTSILPILPTLAILDQQITLLGSTGSVPNLEAKTSAFRALDTVPPDKTNGTATDGNSDIAALSSEDISQLRSMQSLVPTVASLGPTVPAVLVRLRSLRHLHADAAKAGQAMNELERRQDETEKEIQRWQEGIEKLETAVQNAEGGMKVNVEQVESWMKDLEVKIQGLRHVEGTRTV